MRVFTHVSPGRIRERRIALGLTQVALAERIGVSEITVSRWESGAFGVASGRLADLAAALESTEEELRTPPPSVPSPQVAAPPAPPHAVPIVWKFLLLAELGQVGADVQQIAAIQALCESELLTRILELRSSEEPRPEEEWILEAVRLLAFRAFGVVKPEVK